MHQVGYFVQILLLTGEVIIQQGDEGQYMCILIEGKATVSFNGQTVATLNENTAFGEAALKHKVERNASITADKECKILLLYREDYERIILDHDKLRKRQNLQFLYTLPYLERWDNLQKYNLNEIIDTKLVNHNELVYKQGDMAYTFNIIRAGYVKLCTNLHIGMLISILPSLYHIYLLSVAKLSTTPILALKHFAFLQL